MCLSKYAIWGIYKLYKLTYLKPTSYKLETPKNLNKRHLNSLVNLHLSLNLQQQYMSLQLHKGINEYTISVNIKIILFIMNSLL